MPHVAVPAVTTNHHAPARRPQIPTFDRDAHVFADGALRQLDAPGEAVGAILGLQGRRVPAEQVSAVVLARRDQVGQVGVGERTGVDDLAESAEIA